MRQSRFTQERIVAILNQSENGISTGDLTRKLGISEATFYRWKKKYSGMGIAELRRLKVLEGENRKLKQLVAAA
ncbi:transposase [Candidatus Marinimicrobia bacterium MT.SAG.2]|nr:transposase [Candidatus Marinimicrobia bacterium MT.SAG.2]